MLIFITEKCTSKFKTRRFYSRQTFEHFLTIFSFELQCPMSSKNDVAPVKLIGRLIRYKRVNIFPNVPFVKAIVGRTAHGLHWKVKTGEIVAWRKLLFTCEMQFSKHRQANWQHGEKWFLFIWQMYLCLSLQVEFLLTYFKNIFLIQNSNKTEIFFNN
jgi:hypothetical protein